MNCIKKSPILLLMAALFFIASCQSSSTTDNKSADESSTSIYSENEIPISTESEEALEQIVKGLNYLDQGNRLNARSYFDKAIELDPECVSAHLYRSYSSMSWKEWSERRDNVLAMRDKANEAEQLIMDMMENGKGGDAVQGLELAKKMVAKYPESARATEMLANAYNNLEKRDDARAQWTKAIEQDGNFILAIRNLGESYLSETPKDFGKAEEYMSLLVEKVPESSRAHIDLGDCFRAQNNLEKALASYTKAAELDPKDPVALSKAGHANSFLGNYDDARANFQASRAVSMHQTGSYNFEAYTYIYDGDLKKGMDFLLNAVKEVDAMDIPDGNKSQTKFDLVRDCAAIAMHQGDAKQLKSLVDQLRPLSVQRGKDIGSDNAVRNQKANMLRWDAAVSAMNGDYKDAAAKADMIKATLESSENPNKMDRYHRVHAMVNYIQKDYKKALEHMDKIDSDDIYNKYWQAKAHQLMGNSEKAMELCKELAVYNFNFVQYALIRNEVKEMLNSVTS